MYELYATSCTPPACGASAARIIAQAQGEANASSAKRALVRTVCGTNVRLCDMHGRLVRLMATAASCTADEARCRH